MKPDRRVIMICGPPGAGKTTLARALAEAEELEVFDSDDPGWEGEAHFRRSLKALGRSDVARAVVIRTAATRRGRGQAAAMIRPTEVRVMATPLETCIAQIKARGRKHPSIRRQIAAAKWWHRDYEPGDPIKPTPAKPKPTGRRPWYGPRHQAVRRQWAPKVEAGVVPCARCGELIPAGAPWDLGHIDGDRNRYQGPEHRRCNRATASTLKRQGPGRSRKW